MHIRIIRTEEHRNRSSAKEKVVDALLLPAVCQGLHAISLLTSFAMSILPCIPKVLATLNALTLHPLVRGPTPTICNLFARGLPLSCSLHRIYT